MAGGLLLLPVVLADHAVRYARDLGSSVSTLFAGVGREEIGRAHV